MAKRSRSSRGLTQSQKTFVTKAYQAANLAGLSGVQADLAVSQAIHESAWGTKPSGVNNYHGIKGKGSKVKTHEIEAGKRKNITASFRNFGDMAGSFRAWAGLMRDKFSGVMSAKTLPEAVKALRAGKPGGYATDPDYNQKVIGTATKLANVGYGPWGAPEQAPGYVADMANAYRTAAYQRAMPGGPTPPATAPVPTNRPLDNIGGLGATYNQANFQGRVAPSSQIALAGERFGTRPSPASAPAPSRFGAVTAQDDVPMQAQPRSPPMGVVSGPLGPTPTARMPDQSQRFRPSAPQPQPTARPDYASPQQRMAGVAPPSATVSNMLAGRNMPVSPAPATPAPAMAIDPGKMYAYAGRTRSLAPAAPVGSVATPAPVAAQYVNTGPKRSVAAAPTAAPTPSRFGAVTTQDDVAMAPQPNSPPLGAVTAPFGPVNAPSDALAAARQLGAAIAAKQTPAAIPPDPRQTAYASMPPGTPAALAEKVSQPEQAAQQRPAQAAQQRPSGGIPAGVPGPWGADIANQQPAVDRTVTGSIKAQDPAHPPGFMGKLGDFAQRYGPQIAGTLIAGPVGGIIGGLLGRSFDAAKPSQVLGNPFQGLANTAKAMGMFQSGTPYAGPVSTYGYGTRAIGDVLGGAAPVGARAYSRSTPGYHVTSLPNGVVQKTNQYGFTSFERPSMAPTASSFPGGFSSAPGGVFSGGGFGGFFGGGGQSSGKTSGGRTSGKSSSGSRGGRKSERSESAGY